MVGFSSYMLITVVVCMILCSFVKAFNESECHYLLPQPGKWVERAPYFIPDKCKGVQAFDVEDTKKCMSGRTLYVIGNSVARQSAFELISMLGGADVKRENQRDACPKHETFWGDSCHNEFAGVKIRYLFIQYMDGFYYKERNGFPPPFIKPEKREAFLKLDADTRSDPNKFKKALGENSQFWADDNCIQHNMRECLGKFFQDATEDDVLMFTMGMPYGGPSAVMDMKQWIYSQASAWRSHITATFPGHVFRVTLAPYGPKLMASTPTLRVVDDILEAVWYPSGQDDRTQWYTIDQWAINENRQHLYNDHVHFVGPLTNAQLHQMLNEICPGGGKSIGDYTMWNKVVKVKDFDTTVTNSSGTLILNETVKSETSYLMDKSGFLHLLSGPCVDLISSAHEVIEMTALQLKGYSQASPLPDVCQDRTLVRVGNQKEIFMIDKGKLRSIPNGGVLMKLGFEFGDEKVVDEYVLNLFPRGPSMTANGRRVFRD